MMQYSVMVVQSLAYGAEEEYINREAKITELQVFEMINHVAAQARHSAWA